MALDGVNERRWRRTVRTAELPDEPLLMQRVALARLRRCERIAAVADASGSPLWRRLAGHAAAAAMHDCLLVGPSKRAGSSAAAA
jgi:hypothetical protein